MTRQSPAPIVHTSLNPTYVTLADLANRIESGHLDLDPEYQRGDVWVEDQRVALVRSWLTGLPAGVVILADRCNPAWARAHGGKDPYDTPGEPLWACVDGKQRLTTALMWRNSEFAVPASWRPDLVETTELTADGPYVRFNGLTAAGQRFMDRYCSLMIAETKDCGTVAEEAAFYLLVNGGGTPQTDATMAHAARVAEGE